MKITKELLQQIIKEEILNEATQGEMQFAPLETARQAYLQEPNDDTKHELGLMVQKLVEPLMNEMGLFWEAEAYYNVGNLVFNNRKVEVTIDPKGAMGRYDVNVSAQVSAMDTDPAFKPMDITLPSMKGVVQFINDKVFSSSGMVGEPEAQTELPLEHKIKITKSELQQIIKEELLKEFDGPYGDDVDTPSLQAQMSDAILAAVEAMDAGDLKAARAAFSEELLKNLRPYTGPVGKGASAAEMEDYESDYRDAPSKPLKTGKGRRAPSKAQLDMMKDYDI